MALAGSTCLHCGFVLTLDIASASASVAGCKTLASATKRHRRMLCTLLWGWEMDSHSKKLLASPAAATSATQPRLNSSNAPSSFKAYLHHNDCKTLMAAQKQNNATCSQPLTRAWGPRRQTAPA